MAEYQIPNWGQYQSYKDRKPTWIRLHKSLVDNFEYHGMSDAAKFLLPMLWLLASEDPDPKSGVIPYDTKTIAFRLRLPDQKIKRAITELISNGFIMLYNRSESVQNPYVERVDSVTSETETETEKRQRRDREEGDPRPPIDRLNEFISHNREFIVKQVQVVRDSTYQGRKCDNPKTSEWVKWCLDSARSWVLAEPVKGNKKNMGRFIAGWLRRDAKKDPDRGWKPKHEVIAEERQAERDLLRGRSNGDFIPVKELIDFAMHGGPQPGARSLDATPCPASDALQPGPHPLQEEPTHD